MTHITARNATTKRDGFATRRRMNTSTAVGAISALAVASLFAPSANAQCDVAPTPGSLIEPSNLASDGFGNSAFINGNVAIIGSPYDDDNGASSGSASIFRFNGSSWQHEALLRAGDGQPSDFFGSSVAIAGDWALVGATGDEDYAIATSSNIGSVYVFRRVSNQWVQQPAKLFADTPKINDQFGWALAMDGNVAVATTIKDGGLTNQGAAYVFRLVNNVWTKERKLNASGATANFGSSVSVQGNVVAVGAPNETSGTMMASGAAYIFEYVNPNWVQRQRLVSGDPLAGGYFGASVAVNGDTAVVGSTHDDDKGAASGSAFIFRRSGNVWNQSQKILASDGAAGDQFGRSASVSSNILVVGSKRSWSAGAAYAWRKQTNFVFENQIIVPGLVFGDSFGWAVGVSGETAIIAAPNSDITNYNGGAAWFFTGACGASNTAPVLTVSSPANNSVYTAGQAITFNAAANDAEEGDITSDIQWSSSIQGALGSGTAFSLSNLVVGSHVITAYVADADGLDDLVNRNVTVNPTANTAPTLTINSPANGSSYAQGQSITFSGTATDTQDGTLSNSIVWSSNIQSPSTLGTGASISRSNLVVGTHTITATVTDSGGLSQAKTRTVTVTAVNTAPVVTIASPANGSSFNYGSPINFSATANDQQQGDMTSALTWTSNLQGTIGSGGSFSRSNLIAGAHIITAYVTDTGGLLGSAVRTISVVALPINTAPVVNISSPVNNLRVTAGTPITFTATATDAESGNLSSLIFWTSTMQGQIGVGGSFTLSNLAVGTHTITAAATDAGQLTGSATRTIIIDPAPTPAVDSTPNSGTLINGTVSGSVNLTQLNDGAIQSITEKATSGNPNSRISSLEYRWTFAVPTGGTQRSFHLNAWREGPEPADTFTFAYSTNGSTWTNMVTVAQTTDSGTYQTFTLPGTLSGTVYVRVVDDNRTPGQYQLDKIHVDHMFIRKQ